MSSATPPTVPRPVPGAPVRRRGRWLWAGLAGGAGVVMLLVLPIVLIAGAGSQCTVTPGGTPAGASAGSGGFQETAYGPPWNALNGTGQAAYGPNLTAGQRMLEIAIDPSVLTPRGYYHVWPNPFGARGAFLAGDTGGAILGHHIDTYDWKGRSHQLAWGTHTGVSVTPAATPGAGNAAGQIQAPANTLTPTQGGCAQAGTPNLTPGVYANPFAASIGLTPLRIDMGVDYSATGPIGAIGDATVTYSQAAGTGWGPFSCSGGDGGAVVYQLTDGPDRGRYVYTAEGIIPTVTTGQHLRAGQPIATFTGCIEIGWGSGNADSTQAAALGQECAGDPGCRSTACGQNMSELIHALGAKPGIPQGPIYGQGC